MHPVTALALATPIWGFALRPPAAPAVVAARAADVEPAAAIAPEDLAIDAEAEQVEHRNEVATELTRWLQLVSTVGLGVTTALGAIQFADEYGFHGSASETACATGDAVFADCGRETPWAHLVAAGTASVLGLGALVASTQVDYERAARRDGGWRVYEVTRWIGFGLAALQATFGALLANAIRFGWADPQADFETLQGFAIGHLALGAGLTAFETVNTILLF